MSARTLTLMYIALSLVVLTLFAAPVWYAWRKFIDENRTHILQADTQRLEEVYVHKGRDALIAAIDSRIDVQPEGDEKYILFADSSLKKIAGNLRSWPADIPPESGTYTLPIEAGGRSIYAVVVRTTLPGGYHLLEGRNLAYHKQVEHLFMLGLGCATAVILILGALGGWTIRRALLSEVQRISQTTSAIVEGDLSQRLPIHGGKAELDMMALTVNRMLDQIEQLIQGVKNISNAIAHDLRTPLAELRSRLEELSMTRPPLDKTYNEIETAVADVDRVIGIFNALLRLAEIDTGARRSGFVQVNLNRIAEDAVEFYQPVAEMKDITLSFQSGGQLTTAGDPLLLAQAIGNLIDNAIKYAPAGSKIRVETEKWLNHSDIEIGVSVADSGPGIPDAEKSKVVERFYRSDASRGTPGVGLGLSLVASVARLHNGNLHLSDNAPGLKATLALRRTSSPTAIDATSGATIANAETSAPSL
ncbi:MAG: ATP-binding protein [Burkholderiaceae bacterium]